ncbi:extracellular solute-binding protein [Paenibacillaceae bacterium]|nr:extracellular solute-binding protein [Paenibacillaceae bacterium]
MKKKWSAIGIVMLAAMLLVSACSSGGKGSSGEGGSSNKTLKLWTWKVAYVPGFEAAAELYKEKTGVKVEIETFTPDDTYRQKVQAAANSKNLPDVIHYWATNGDSLETSLLELTSEVKDDVLSNYFGPAMDPIKVTDKQVENWASDKNATNVQKALKAGEFYGLPLDIGGFFTFYGNKKLIEQAGLEAVAPKTWEEFVTMMETVQKETSVPALVFGAKLPDLWENWAGSALQIMLNGPEGYINLLERNAQMSDPSNIKVPEALGVIAEKNLLMPGVLSTDIDGADQAFASGKAAFDLGGSFTMSTLLAMGMKAEDIIAFPVPPIAGSKLDKWATDPFTLTMMSVNKDTKNKDEALDFIKFITSDADAAVAFSNGAFTVSAMKIGDRSADLSPALKSMQESFATEPGPYSQVQPYIDNRGKNKEWEEFFQSMQSVMEKKMTVADATKKFDERMKSLQASGN